MEAHDARVRLAGRVFVIFAGRNNLYKDSEEYGLSPAAAGFFYVSLLWLV
ncbi:MAG: hypothetical protein Q4A74_01750 [Cardiobacteriaceae bacterium]|nr:hypothetical protein [Cardiobacteriaceae bacterium]